MYRFVTFRFFTIHFNALLQVVRAVLNALQYPAKSFLVGKDQLFLKSFVLPQLNLRIKSQVPVKSKTIQAKAIPSQIDEQANQVDSSEVNLCSCATLSLLAWQIICDWLLSILPSRFGCI
ncbi:hypothetical protein AHF37_09246 [Paragonimus kellicotti]|nr:hypothetical protein AHF37_09246 [Paragonimus kellicotti]